MIKIIRCIRDHPHLRELVALLDADLNSHYGIVQAQYDQFNSLATVDAAPKYLVRDNDAIYGHAFSERMDQLGIEEVPITPRSPWQNPYVERLIGTIRRECLTTGDSNEDVTNYGTLATQRLRFVVNVIVNRLAGENWMADCGCDSYGCVHWLPGYGIQASYRIHRSVAVSLGDFSDSTPIATDRILGEMQVWQAGCH